MADNSKLQKEALEYARTAAPLDPEQGWRREDVQLAYMSGAQSVPITRLLSAQEVGAVLGTSVATVRDLVAHGEIAFVSVGRGTERKYMMFTAPEVESFIRRRTERVNSRSSGVKTVRVKMTTDRMDFDEARAQLLAEGRSRKEREAAEQKSIRDAAAAWEKRIEEKRLKSDARNHAAAERMAKKRKAVRESK